MPPVRATGHPRAAPQCTARPSLPVLTLTSAPGYVLALVSEATGSEQRFLSTWQDDGRHLVRNILNHAHAHAVDQAIAIAAAVTPTPAPPLPHRPLPSLLRPPPHPPLLWRLPRRPLPRRAEARPLGRPRGEHRREERLEPADRGPDIARDLDLGNETRSWGIEVPQVIADGGYGDTAAFRLGLETRGLDYVVGISTTTTAQPEDARPSTPTYVGRGRRPVPAYPESAQRVKDLVIAAGKSSARPVQWREGSRPGSGRSGVKRMYSRFVALRIRPAGRENRKATAAAELPVRWLLAEWTADQDEPVQFWLSNLPATTPLPVLVRTAKLRWRIENDYREMKQALDLAHFEGRTRPGWHHHVTLVSVAHAFCTLQRLSRSPKETASA
ncbi:transposase [Streptomyces sp. NBC_01116]|uniref:IS701 family transposase n=1 Tax=Streptomyces sp. NBC_01116 TaxID=2903752 RepID=UPI00325327F6